jgi:hypothetical protein
MQETEFGVYLFAKSAAAWGSPVSLTTSLWLAHLSAAVFHTAPMQLLLRDAPHNATTLSAQSRLFASPLIPAPSESSSPPFFASSTPSRSCSLLQARRSHSPKLDAPRTAVPRTRPVGTAPCRLTPLASPFPPRRRLLPLVPWRTSPTLAELDTSCCRFTKAMNSVSAPALHHPISAPAEPLPLHQSMHTCRPILRAGENPPFLFLSQRKLVRRASPAMAFGRLQCRTESVVFLSIHVHSYTCKIHNK